MENQLKDHLNKFKKDIISKIFYDVFKYIFTILVAAPLIFVFINRIFCLSTFEIFWIIYITVIITLIPTIIYTTKRYNLLKKDNHSDELTGMFNHKAFTEKVPQIIANCKEKNIQLSFIMIDIDNFKKFNENFTYQIADEVLKKVGMLLNSDNRATDISFRQYFKGDEFIIIAKETSISNATIAAERKRILLKSGIQINNSIYNLTVSCGVTEYNFLFDDINSVLSRLNNALKIAKQSGKDCVKPLY